MVTAEPPLSMSTRVRVTTALFGSSPSSQIASQGLGDVEANIDGLDADQDVVPSSQDKMTDARYAVSVFDLFPRTCHIYFMHLCTHWYLRFYAFVHAVCTPNFLKLLKCHR
jgi:hypothetical protein